ncbi:hypothetical protein ABFG93_06950 [Pseudalkalibacillus hwajinpoensis]|uniref:hypothetical protein n=1 Tax=Guptibacillus hwajinpoensis TaxID=208199 RepID=UPI00325AF54E
MHSVEFSSGHSATFLMVISRTTGNEMEYLMTLLQQGSIAVILLLCGYVFVGI